MLTIGIYPNTKKSSISTVLSWMLEYLKEKNVRAILPPEVARILNYPELAGNPETMKDEMALAITLGGDGTLLNTSRDIAPAGIPVCGVNMGQLGFLTEVELPDLSVAMDRLIAGDYEIEERLMLDTMVIRDGQTIYISPALNDVVVTKGGFSRMIRLKLFVDDELAANYPADGVIISTSTGSTGYSLSSGGPIVNPSLKVILITPICPHTLHARSMVISEEEEIKIRMQATHDDIVLTVDGQTVNNLLPDDIVLVRRSSFRARFIKFPGKSYYEVLRTKLRRGDRDGGS